MQLINAHKTQRESEREMDNTFVVLWLAHEQLSKKTIKFFISYSLRGCRGRTLARCRSAPRCAGERGAIRNVSYPAKRKVLPSEAHGHVLGTFAPKLLKNLFTKAIQKTILATSNAPSLTLQLFPKVNSCSILFVLRK